MKTNIPSLSYLAHYSQNGEFFSGKFVETIKTHILCSVTFSHENRAVYEIMWKNIVHPDRPQMKIWRTNIACWIPKATNTHSQYVTLTAYPPQQWLHEHVLMLRFKEHCLYCHTVECPIQ